MSTSASIAVGQVAAWERSLAQSQAHCVQVVRERAANFYHGLKLVPEPKRSACYALYAWMRLADDLADEAGNAEAKTRTIEQFRRTTMRAIDADLNEASAMPEGELWPAVRDMVLRYGLPVEYLDDMIEGQLLDQHKTRYATFEELYDYCYKVASVVGLSCVTIWGYEGGEATRKLAEQRGIAFQLTNILRDVLEDAQRDRVYLPADAFEALEINPVMFTMGDKRDALEGIKEMAEKAEGYYKASEPLEARVSGDGRACLWAMTRIYRGLLYQIRRDPARVLSGERVRLSKLHKCWIALRAKYLPIGLGGGTK